MADRENIMPFASSFSIEELVNGVILHPQFRDVISNMCSSTNSNSSACSSTTSTVTTPSSSSQSSATAATTSYHQSPAEELRAIFRRGTSSQQQQNVNATVPRFNSRFSYQPRRRTTNNRQNKAPYNANGSKGKWTEKRGGKTSAKQCFFREVVLLNSPDETKVVRGHGKAALHRGENVISAFKFEKSWCFSTVCEELRKAFPQLENIDTTPK